MKVVVTAQDIKKVAKMSCIELDQAQIEFFARQLEIIVSYCSELENFGEIEEFDVDRPTNVFREDKVEASLSVDVVNSFAESKDNFLKIPKFLE